MTEKYQKAASAAKLVKDKMACNKPQKTPGHPTKSHVVKACDKGEEKIIRFGQQGVEGAGKNQPQKKIKLEENHIMLDIMHKIQTLIKCQHDGGRTRSSGK